MMSGIPLPKIVADVQAGGPFVTAMNGLNTMLQGNATAKYAPYQAYADAYLKNQQAQWLPYQYKMQALSNPMLWMAAQNNPALRDQITKMMSDPMQGIGGAGVNIPQPQSGVGNGLFGALLNKLGIGAQSGQPQNPMQAMGATLPAQSTNSLLSMPGNVNSPSSSNAQIPNENVGNSTGSAMLPSTPISAYVAKQTAPFNTQIPEPGKTYRDPNTHQVISAPSGSFTTDLQRSINAAQRVAPQLDRISKEAEPFMSFAGEANTQYQRLGNYFMGQKGELPTKYAKFQADLQAAPEALVKSYGLRPTNETIERMSNVIEPYRGENGDQYKKRILDTLDQIQKEQIGIGTSQLYGGIPVNSGNSQSGTIQGNIQQPPQNIQQTPNNFDSKQYANYKFKNPDEFENSFNSLSETAKNQAFVELSSKGLAKLMGNVPYFKINGKWYH